MLVDLLDARAQQVALGGVFVVRCGRCHREQAEQREAGAEGEGYERAPQGKLRRGSVVLRRRACKRTRTASARRPPGSAPMQRRKRRVTASQVRLRARVTRLRERGGQGVQVRPAGVRMRTEGSLDSPFARLGALDRRPPAHACSCSSRVLLAVGGDLRRVGRLAPARRRLRDARQRVGPGGQGGGEALRHRLGRRARALPRSRRRRARLAVRHADPRHARAGARGRGRGRRDPVLLHGRTRTWSRATATRRW